jgi:hypothetical protein
MLNHLVVNNLLDKNQHGFVFAKSCQTNLIESLDALTDALESHHEIVLILLDFAKAFDKVCHQYLLVKLAAYGFDDTVCDWVKAFLSNRKQRVVIGDFKSDWADVLSGVPQGSVLGPLLFLIFINDMPGLVKHLCKLFADDTKLIGVIKSPSDLTELQQDIDRLVEWSHTWHMKFNEDKCKAMFFGLRVNNMLNTAYHQFDDSAIIDPLSRHKIFTMRDQHGSRHNLVETSSERDLGVIINERLDWSDHIAHMKAKAYKTLGMLKRAFRTWDSHNFRILYSTYVRPHLEYCSSVWNSSSILNIKEIEKVQEHASKIIPQLRNMSYESRLKAIGIPTLSHRRRKGDLIHYFKFVKGFNKVSWVRTPITAPSLFTNGPAAAISGHNIRAERQIRN